MILTVTFNTAIDKILFIDEWVTGTPMRTNRIVTSVGGKGLDSSVVLRHLGVETVGLCFVAGKTGEELIKVARGYGITPEPVWVNGETRVAHVISELKYHRHSHIIAGELRISQEHCTQFLELFKIRARQANWVICAGSVPASVSPTFYRTILESANEVGIPVLIDTYGDFILQAIPAEPAIIKMNHDEFTATFRQEMGDILKLEKQAWEIFLEKKLKSLVITCAVNGIIAVTPEGGYHAVAPEKEAINAAGAGDAVSSALAWRFSEGDGWMDALKWAAATSAAVVLTEGTADCDMNDISRILPDVKIERFHFS